jgi:dihydrodipicolinate reductase
MTKIGIIGSAGRMGAALVEAIAAAGQTHAGGVDQDGDLAALVAALTRSKPISTSASPQPSQSSSVRRVLKNATTI